MRGYREIEYFRASCVNFMYLSLERCRLTCLFDELALYILADYCEQSIIDILLLQVSIPDKNDDRVIGELSRRNEPLNAFLDRFRRLEPLQVKILQRGQHSCCSAPSHLLQSARDTWRKLLG
jgi:hypothetical protein